MSAPNEQELEMLRLEAEVERLRQYEPLKGGVPIKEWRLQQELKLAVEGLANYAQENEQLKARPFRDVLTAEIAKQEALIKRMDSNPDFDNGMMAMIRLERLQMLERLLDFEPKPVLHPSVTQSEKT